MNLTELKQKQISEVIEIAESLGLENVARSRKQDLIFAILKKQAKAGDDISGDGVFGNSAGWIWFLTDTRLFLSGRPRRHLRFPQPNQAFFPSKRETPLAVR